MVRDYPSAVSDRWIIGAPRAAWMSRRHLGYAADVLRHTACATCSLGSKGLRDHVAPGLHLCGRRLDDLDRLLAEPMEHGALRGADLLDRDGLRALGRLSTPQIRRRGGRFEPLTWTDAANLLGRRLREQSWSLHVGDEDLGDEDAWMLAQMAQQLGATSIQRRGSVRPRWIQALEAATGFGASPSSLADLPDAQRIVLWGPVDRTHPELRRWLPRRAEILTIGTSIPGHRRLEGDPVAIARRGCAAAWRGRSKDLIVGKAPPDVPEPAFVEPALHLVDATLDPAPFLALALLQGAIGKPGTGLVVLGGRPGVAELGLDRPGPCGDVVVTVGDAHTSAPEAAFRAHLGWFADPSMLLEPAGEVLVLPLLWRTETPGGTTTTSADRTIRFSPQVLGHGVAQARALPDLIGEVLSLTGKTAPTDAVSARGAITDAWPWRGDLRRLKRPGDGYQWGGRQPLADGMRTEDGCARVPEL
jgi:hypothetical protein